MTEEQRALAERVARRYRIDGMTRADVEQEAIALILAALRDGITDPAHLYNYVRNRLRTLATRGMRWRGATADADIPDTSHDGRDDVDERDAVLVLLDRYGGELLPREREVLELTYATPTCDAMIAAAWGCREETVQRQRARALVKLRNAAKSIGEAG